MKPIAVPQEVLAAFDAEGAPAVPITHGHINATFRLDAPTGTFVLQRLNPIFAPEVNLDIEVLTGHVAAAGLQTPRLRRTRAGAAWQQADGGDIWRALTFVPGPVFAQATSAGQCHGAGALLGAFHRALSGVQHQFHARRPGVHDTPAHLKGLQSALRDHGDHPAYAAVAPLADAVFTALDALPRLDALPARIVHGDPKLSNVVFTEAQGAEHNGATQACASPPTDDASAAGPGGWPARAMVDLDTMAPMSVHLELGDALRSWCNPAGEGPEPAQFSLPYLAAAMAGYAAGARDLLTPAEVHAIAPGVALITLELCARFLRDALEERYFGWDATRYDHAWQHHLVRARSQHACHLALRAHGSAVDDTVARVFGLTA